MPSGPVLIRCPDGERGTGKYRASSRGRWPPARRCWCSRPSPSWSPGSSTPTWISQAGA